MVGVSTEAGWMEQERERLKPDTNSLSDAVNTTAGVGTETLVELYC